MKRVMILFFIINILSFSVVKGNTDNLIIAKNQQEITDEKIDQLNARIVALEKEIKYRPATMPDNGGYVYNLDQIYNNSLRYYEKSSSDIKWLLGAIAVLLGFFKWDSDKKLKDEKKDIKDDNKEIKKENQQLRDKIEEKTLTLSNEFTKKIQKYEEHMKKQIQEKTSNLEDEFNKIMERHEKEIKKIKDKIEKDKKTIEKDREIVEFNSAFTAALNKVKPEEKIEELNKLNKSSSKFTNPQKSQIYSELAYQYINLKQYEKAILDYNKAIELDPYYKIAYNNRGSAKSELKQYEKAILDYSKAIELDPYYKDSYCNRGTAKSELKQYEKSILDYSKAIELDLYYKEAYYNRGTAKTYLKQYEEAILDFDKAIELDPYYKDPYYNRGTAKTYLKQYEEAILDFDKVINLDPQNELAYGQKAFTLLNLGKYNESILMSNIMIKLNPKDRDTYNNRAEAQLFLKEYKLALEDLMMCLEIDKKCKFGIDISQENYNKFKTFLENLENKNELQLEVYNRLLLEAKGGFTIKKVIR